MMLQVNKDMRVAVMGASGGIGQPLSLLLKMMPIVSHLNLYDIAHTPGVAADLSHIETRAKVTGFIGDAQVRASLEGTQVVIIPAGVPRKPGKNCFFFNTCNEE
jgi:malate dehydrogenase